MIVTTRELIYKARECIGTPYHHQGRTPEFGIDCIGLIAWTCWQLELLPKSYDYTDYASRPDGVTLCKEFDKVFQPLPDDEIRPGAIIVFSMPVPRHCGLVTDKGIIHTWSKYLTRNPSPLAGRVVEHPYVGKWPKFYHSAYWIPGVV